MNWRVKTLWDNGVTTETTVSESMRVTYLTNLPWVRIETITVEKR